MVVRDSFGSSDAAACSCLVGHYSPAVAEIMVPSNSYVYVLAKDCLSIATEIEFVSFNFVRRSANGVAHVLAQTTQSMSASGEWLDLPPPFIVNALVFDSF
ncbi:hypothetical protein GH714_030451 [Hevea brasiliensis]|uniref:RNase H type-1 domain-containing protein n=1 Tax=Hevea brasiliensis TaxID=3981 RepID=A0A6A6NK74_HEVBR|nr:hypothetical protein GH714_030451 [Hevea brasiliensis]